MGNGSCNNHHNTIHHQHHFHQKSIFWPMLCRLSIKDINLDNHCKDRIRGDEEPRSPKVSCMGQVKRNNRVIGYPTAAAAAAVNHHHKYTKLKKLFSSKALMGPATVATAPSVSSKTRSRSCRANKDMCVNNSTKLKLKNHSGPISGVDRQDCAKVVNVGEMDPPLPVVKKAAPPGIGHDEVNLWKRRFHGGGLKSLQIDQQIHCHVQPPTTV